jgi:hypothetical protein
MTMRRRDVAGSIAVAVVVAAAFAACDQAPTEVQLADGSFAQLHRTVLAPSCAVSGCHVGSSAALSGDLVLSADAAYSSLIGVAPTNLNARNAGLRRVVKFQPDSSLLYQKILAANTHAGAYGGLMPVGVAPLSVGQIEFIRKWIEAGAPDRTFVADSLLLRDATSQVSNTFTPLEPPAAGTGYQLKIDAFTVRSDFERELFEYRAIGNTEKIYVNRLQTLMRPFSHHFVLYTFGDPANNPFCSVKTNVVRDIRKPDGSLDLFAMAPMSCHIFFGGSMVQQGDYRFPAGVGLELPANAALDLNVHYVNRTTGVVPGEAYANIYTMPAASVQKVAHTLNLPNLTITLPPNRVTTISKVFTVSETTTIFALTSHMHALGTRFEIQIVGGARDGESVYVNTDWEHPQLVTYATPIVLRPGEGLRSIVTWNNTSSKTVSFGLQSTDEMAIIFGYYY